MRKAIENHLNRIWYSPGRPPWYLRTLVPAYKMLAAVHRKRQLRGRAVDLDRRCIVVVGNLTAGGTGKTPLIIRLCELLADAGMKPGVISRGYGRNDRGQRRVTGSSNADRVGDEPLLIAQKTGVPVAVGPSRIAAARDLFAGGVQVVLSDDGLQHLRLPRSIEICVVDGERGLGNGFLLPAGPLREDAARIATVDEVIVNGGDRISGPVPGLPDDLTTIPMDVHPGKVQSLSEPLSWRLSQFTGCRVCAVAGIANPERFFDLLRAARIQVEEHVFPDHHQFTPADFTGLPQDLPVIMTEKDAVKCMDMQLKNCWYLSIDAQLPAYWESAFVNRVKTFLNEN